MQKKIAIFTIVFGLMGLALPLAAQNTFGQMYLNLRQKQAIENLREISFMGRPYYFGYGTQTKNEYFTPGEGFNGWSSLIGVHVFKNATDPLLVANGMYNRLLGDNLAAKLAIHRFSKEPILTFYLKTAGGLELNIWRFYQNQDQTEVIGMQFARTFKVPDSKTKQKELNTLVQTASEQFVNLPKQPFIW